jgi:RNA polymerase sigma-70 factor (ECF subfamily)
MQDHVYLSLIARCRTGDEQAADEIFRHYVEQLVGLARTRLSARLAQRVDAEDVVQSVFRSFFAGTRAGRYELQNGGDLWRLLVAITLHKLHTLYQRNTRARRDLKRDQSLSSLSERGDLTELLLAHGPSPLEATVLADEVETLMRRLTPVQRLTLEMRLQGYNLEEIALHTRRSVRTITRNLELVKNYLQEKQPGTISVEGPQGR